MTTRSNPLLAVAAALMLPAAAMSQTSPAPAAASAVTSGAPAAGAASQTKAAETPITLEPQGYEYDATGRRDPFVNLIRRGADAQRSAAGTRPPGLGGLETAEVTLKGTMQSREGYVAMLQGADTRTYIVRPGDRLLDGSIRAISGTAVVIVQQVNDPLSRERQREVRKTIRQIDEAK